MTAKSRPPEDDRRPGTFSTTTHCGLSSATMRWNSNQSPERSPSKPARLPATLRSWHGKPPQTRSTAARLAAPTCRTSSNRRTSGQWFAKTDRAAGSISTCQAHAIPARSMARSKPPIRCLRRVTRRSVASQALVAPPFRAKRPKWSRSRSGVSIILWRWLWSLWRINSRFSRALCRACRHRDDALIRLAPAASRCAVPSHEHAPVDSRRVEAKGDLAHRS